MPDLSLKKVSKRRGETMVLDRFSLDLPAGGQVALVGPSGSGKSTLLGLICGVLKPDQGQVLWGDQDLSALPSAERAALRAAEMGIVFQNLSLVSALTVEANLLFSQRMAGRAEDAGAAQSQLARLGIDHRRRAKPRHMSRGEVQRAAIARALLIQPQLLLADEPTASLDARWRDIALDLMLETARQNGTSVIIATHDLAVADRFDRQITLAHEPAS